MPPRVQDDPEAIEPLVQFIEETPSAELIDRTLEKFRAGVPLEAVQTAAARAVARCSYDLSDLCADENVSRKEPIHHLEFCDHLRVHENLYASRSETQEQPGDHFYREFCERMHAQILSGIIYEEKERGEIRKERMLTLLLSLLLLISAIRTSSRAYSLRRISLSRMRSKLAWLLETLGLSHIGSGLAAILRIRSPSRSRSLNCPVVEPSGRTDPNEDAAMGNRFRTNPLFASEPIEIIRVEILEPQPFWTWLKAVIRRVLEPALVAAFLAAVFEAVIHLATSGPH